MLLRKVELDVHDEHGLCYPSALETEWINIEGLSKCSDKLIVDVIEQFLKHNPNYKIGESRVIFKGVE